MSGNNFVHKDGNLGKPTRRKPLNRLVKILLESIFVLQ
jgi:hypothetical protein